MACEQCMCDDCVKERGDCLECARKDGIIQAYKDRLAELEDRLGKQPPQIIRVPEPCNRPHLDDQPYIPPYNPGPIQPGPHDPVAGCQACDYGKSPCMCVIHTNS